MDPPSPNPLAGATGQGQIVELEAPHVFTFHGELIETEATEAEETDNPSTADQDPLGSGLEEGQEVALPNDDESIEEGTLEQRHDVIGVGERVVVTETTPMTSTGGEASLSLMDHLEENAGAEDAEEEQHSLRIVGVNSLQNEPDEEGVVDVKLESTDEAWTEAHTENQSIFAGADTLNGGDTTADPEMLIIPRKTDWRQKNKSHKRKLAYVMRTPGRNQDVAFIVGASKERILAHSFILWLNSSVFEDILMKGTRDNELGDQNRGTMKEIVLEDVTPEVFKIVLKFMYTEEISVDADNVEDVYKVAKRKFRIYELADYCQEMMKKNISLGSAVKTLQLAQEFKETELYQEALFFILQNGEMMLRSTEFLAITRENLSEILGSDHLAACEMTIFQASIRWATNLCFVHEKKPTPEHLRIALDQVIYKIRFPLMTAEEFKVDVIPTNILQSTEVIDLFSYFTPPFGTVRSNFPFSTTPRFQHEVETSVSNFEISDQQNITMRGGTEEDDQTNVINIPSSSSSESEKNEKKNQSDSPSEDEDEEWKKSSEDSSSDSSDVDFVPPPAYLKTRKRKQQRPLPEILPIKKSTYTSPNMYGLEYLLKKKPNPSPIVPQLHSLDIRKVNDFQLTGGDSLEISSYIKRLMDFNRKDRITKIDIELTIAQVPKLRVCLPNLREFYLKLTSIPLENTKTVKEFKDIALPILRAMKDLIFFGISEGRGGNVPIMELDKLWMSKIKIQISLNGVKVFRSNEEEGDLTCCFVRSPALQSIVEGLIYRSGSMKRLTIAECEFRLFPGIPSSTLRVLTILKVSGLHGINHYLQRCSNLRELYWDGNGVGYRIITLDEDLNLFSPTCKLKRLVISNALISLKNQFAQSQTKKPAMVSFPLFYFCEFSPHVIENFQKIFPYLKHIHFRNYPKISFLEKLLDMEYVIEIGIWGAKLIAEGQFPVNSANFTTFIGHNDLKSKIRKANIPNAASSTQYASHAFFLKRRQRTVANNLQWEVTETLKNPATDAWEDHYLNKMYSSFSYSTILNFNQYKNLFACNY